MDKNNPKKVKDFKAYHSMGYSPRFIRCPSCDRDISETWNKPEECIKCGQKLLWE